MTNTVGRLPALTVIKSPRSLRYPVLVQGLSRSMLVIVGGLAERSSGSDWAHAFGSLNVEA
jgi:hypothetical protein